MDEEATLQAPFGKRKLLHEGSVFQVRENKGECSMSPGQNGVRITQIVRRKGLCYLRVIQTAAKRWSAGHGPPLTETSSLLSPANRPSARRFILEIVHKGTAGPDGFA